MNDSQAGLAGIVRVAALAVVTADRRAKLSKPICMAACKWGGLAAAIQT